MVNEIKLDGLVTHQSIAKVKRNDANPIKPPVASDGITITNQLSSLASTIIAENESQDNQQRILELKHQIQNNQYNVDVDSLAAKLTHSILTS